MILAKRQRIFGLLLVAAHLWASLCPAESLRLKREVENDSVASASSERLPRGTNDHSVKKELDQSTYAGSKSSLEDESSPSDEGSRGDDYELAHAEASAVGGDSRAEASSFEDSDGEASATASVDGSSRSEAMADGDNAFADVGSERSDAEAMVGEDGSAEARAGSRSEDFSVAENTGGPNQNPTVVLTIRGQKKPTKKPHGRKGASEHKANTLGPSLVMSSGGSNFIVGNETAALVTNETSNAAIHKVKENLNKLNKNRHHEVSRTFGWPLLPITPKLKLNTKLNTNGHNSKSKSDSLNLHNLFSLKRKTKMTGKPLNLWLPKLNPHGLLWHMNRTSKKTTKTPTTTTTTTVPTTSSKGMEKKTSTSTGHPSLTPKGSKGDSVVETIGSKKIKPSKITVIESNGSSKVEDSEDSSEVVNIIKSNNSRRKGTQLVVESNNVEDSEEVEENVNRLTLDDAGTSSSTSNMTLTPGTISISMSSTTSTPNIMSTTTGKPPKNPKLTTRRPSKNPLKSTRTPTTKKMDITLRPSDGSPSKLTDRPTTMFPMITDTPESTKKTTRQPSIDLPKVDPDFPMLDTKTTTAKPTDGCTQKPKCEDDMKSGDKLLAVVLTEKGGFRGRRINEKAIRDIMKGSLDSKQVIDLEEQKSITVTTNNSFVFPAGRYYFPHPIRFAGFSSP